jgi:hypothetical protein
MDIFGSAKTDGKIILSLTAAAFASLINSADLILLAVDTKRTRRDVGSTPVIGGKADLINRVAALQRPFVVLNFVRLFRQSLATSASCASPTVLSPEAAISFKHQ